MFIYFLFFVFYAESKVLQTFKKFLEKPVVKQLYLLLCKSD